MGCIGLALGVACLGLGPLDAAPAARTTTNVCPPVIAWSADFQKQLDRELRAAVPGSALSRVAIEMVGVRDQLRACNKRR